VNNVKRLFLVVALLASASTASGSVIYAFHFHSNAFGTTDWQFTVSDFLSAPGTTFITTFDSYSSTFQGGTLFDVQLTDPFSASPSISTEASGGGLSGASWVGPFDHAAIYTAGNATLTISTTAAATPEPSTPALIATGGVLLAIAHRRRWVFQRQLASTRRWIV
jgi:hypothetical protein